MKELTTDYSADAAAAAVDTAAAVGNSHKPPDETLDIQTARRKQRQQW